MYGNEDDSRMQGKLREVDRQNRKRMAEGVFNFLGVLVGIACILVLTALLISLLNWLRTDITTTFSEHSLVF